MIFFALTMEIVKKIRIDSCFLYILALDKATEIIWEDRREHTLCFEYKTDSERSTVIEILTKRFGASIH